MATTFIKGGNIRNGDLIRLPLKNGTAWAVIQELEPINNKRPNSWRAAFAVDRNTGSKQSIAIDPRGYYIRQLPESES